MKDDLIFFTRTKIPKEKDDPYSNLAEFANRIAKLLDSDRVKSRFALVACLDDLLGAVYSLIYATYYDYADRPNPLDPPDIENVKRRATEMSNLKVRTDGKWTAGTYFNGALFRIAAVYHRSLKIFANKEDDKDVYLRTLARIVQDAFKKVQGSEWQDVNLHHIHKEVNDLKHTSSGIYQGRCVEFDMAVAGVNELLVLIETLGEAR